MRYLSMITVAALVGAAPAWSQSVWFSTHLLMPGDIIRQGDVVGKLEPHNLPDVVGSDRDIVGQQIKRRVAADRPLTQPDIGPRSAVLASTSVTVLWTAGPLRMEMEGRAIENGAVGDEIRVLNPTSGRTIRGTVTGDGMVESRSDQ
jgi:flagella basal body P-ring formation protein FlgA